MAKTRPSLTSGRLLLAGGLLAAALVAVWAVAAPWRSELLADYWRERIADASDAQAPATVRQTVALGDAAIPILVESLGSYRTSVAMTARQVLTEEINRWKRLPSQEALPKLALLAHTLAGEIERFGPVGRGWAAEMTEQILRWPLEGKNIEPTRLLADCRRVLQATAAARTQTDWHAQRAAEQLDPLHLAAETNPETEAGAALAEVLAESHLPGGGVPVKPASVRRTQSVDDLAPRAPTGEPPPLQIEPDGAEPLRHARPTAPLPLQLPIADPYLEPAANEAGRIMRTPTATEEPLESLSTLELIRRLRSGEASAVEAELAARGMNARHLELARSVADPDPQVRLALVEELPRIASLDARPWLLWLAEDEAAEVRLAALTVLATSNDPSLLRELAQKARRDADPQIRALAERLLAR